MAGRASATQGHSCNGRKGCRGPARGHGESTWQKRVRQGEDLDSGRRRKGPQTARWGQDSEEQATARGLNGAEPGKQWGSGRFWGRSQRAGRGRGRESRRSRVARRYFYIP